MEYLVPVVGWTPEEVEEGAVLVSVQAWKVPGSYMVCGTPLKRPEKKQQESRFVSYCETVMSYL